VKFDVNEIGSKTASCGSDITLAIAISVVEVMNACIGTVMAKKGFILAYRSPRSR